jgi:hypothetical protein
VDLERRCIFRIELRFLKVAITIVAKMMNAACHFVVWNSRGEEACLLFAQLRRHGLANLHIKELTFFSLMCSIKALGIKARSVDSK